MSDRSECARSSEEVIESLRERGRREGRLAEVNQKIEACYAHLDWLRGDTVELCHTFLAGASHAIGQETRAEILKTSREYSGSLPTGMLSAMMHNLH